MKSILLHVQNDASLNERIQTALALARAAGAHLSCLHVTPIEAYVAFDSFGGVFVMQDVMKALDEQESELRGEVEAKLKQEDVSWDYEQVTGAVANVIVSRVALSDLIIVGRQRHVQAAEGAPLSFLGDLLHRSRTPLFIPAAHRVHDPLAPVLIGWDGSYEAANAVRGSLGLLRLSREVRVVRVSGDNDEGLFPSTRLLEYLSRHGIHADLMIEKESEHVAAAVLLGHAEQSGAQTLVIGGYSHSRIGEYLFGGVTRSLLYDCPVSLLVAH